MVMVSSVVLGGSITSISIDASGPGGKNAMLLYVGTSTGNIYQAIVDLRDGSISQQLVQSAHCAGVTAVAFPELYGEVWTDTFSHGIVQSSVPGFGCRVSATCIGQSRIRLHWIGLNTCVQLHVFQ